MGRRVSQLVYLYGFVPSGTAGPREAVAGVGGGAVRVVDLGPFAAVVSDVDPGEYREDSLEGRLKDLSWVATQGARHETVVTWFSDHATIMPARLLSVFSSEEALRADAEERTGAIEDRLARFRDVREWDLKVSFDATRLGALLGEFSGETAEMDAQIASAAAGRRYLLERKREELVRRETGVVARRLARELLTKLDRLADETVELELPALRDDLPVVLNAALLVRTERTDQLRDTASSEVPALEERGVHASLTGPWAPYRFVGETTRG